MLWQWNCISECLCWFIFAHLHVWQFVISSIRLSTPNWEGTMQQWWKLKWTCKQNWSKWRWLLCTQILICVIIECCSFWPLAGRSEWNCLLANCCWDALYSCINTYNKSACSWIHYRNKCLCPCVANVYTSCSPHSERTWSIYMGEQNCHFGEMNSISLLGMDPQFFSISVVHKIMYHCACFDNTRCKMILIFKGPWQFVHSSVRIPNFTVICDA